MDKEAILIPAGNGYAVNLGFEDVFDGFTRQLFLDVGVEFTETVERIGFLQREHRDGMANVLEFFQWRTADPLGGGIRRNEVRMFGFEFLEFGVELVVVVVGNFGARLNIVKPVMPVDFPAQVSDAFFGVRAIHGRLGQWAGA